MAINIIINKTFNIHNLLKNYPYDNVFNEKIINTLDVLTMIQMCTDENKFW